MGSVTCERCGFVSFATSEVCKQCGSPLPGPAAAFGWRLPQQPQPQQQPNWQPQGAPDWQQQQQAHAGDNWQPPPPQGWPPPPHGNSAHYQAQSNYYAADEGQPKRKGLAAVALVCGLLALPVMIVGALTAIPLGAPAAILGAVLGLVMTIMAVVLGIMGTVRVNRNPAEFAGKGMAIAGIVLGGLMIGSAVPIGVIAAIAVPNLMASRRAANEAAAIGTLRKISSAQATYLSTVGGQRSFGSLDELVENGMLEQKLAAGTYYGYRFEVEPAGDSFVATATPMEYPNTGTRSFYIAEDGVVRGADKQGVAADADDPPINLDHPWDTPGTARRGEPDVDWKDAESMQRRAASDIYGTR